MATIYNRASLTYESNGISRQATSNLATANIMDPISVTKNALTTTYQAGESIPFFLTVTNTCCCSLPEITICDDLGTFAACDGLVTPLTYDNNATIFINGISSGPIVPETATENTVCFTLPSLGRGDTATIIYTATVNEFAPMECGSTITNTATWTAGTCSGSASHTITVVCAANLQLEKTMTPDSLCSGDNITYRFLLSNYGNIPANEVVLTDAFDPAPANITVTVNGEVIQPTDYLYVNGTLTLPYIESSLTLNVPAATFERNENCEVVTTPGTMLITVTGALTTENGCCIAETSGAFSSPITPPAGTTTTETTETTDVYTCPCQRNN